MVNGLTNQLEILTNHLEFLSTQLEVLSSHLEILANLLLQARLDGLITCCDQRAYVAIEVTWANARLDQASGYGHVLKISLQRREIFVRSSVSSLIAEATRDLT